MSAVTLRALAIACAVASSGSAVAAGPQETARTFCRRDALGDRLLARTWPNVAPLIDWVLEPAWDRVNLIDGYELSEARLESGDTAAVEVTYHVAAEVRAGSVVREPRQEKRTLRLRLDEDSGWWRILAPPLPPHVFASQVDSDVMAASLATETGDFLTASAFVWRFLDGAGWSIAPFTAGNAHQLAELAQVDDPQPGDIVLYYDGEEPYHIGIVEAEDTILSATLNGGLRRAPLDAFAGTVRYRRPRTGARYPTAQPTALPSGPPAEKTPRPSPATP
jgi:hypothetical protein